MIPKPADDPKVRDACQERCAGYGEPPCYEITEPGEAFDPCTDCLRDAGIEPPVPLDPNAVIRDLF